MIRIGIYSLFLFLMCFNIANAGDLERGKTLSASCAACHGPDGNSQIATNPKLAGQNEKYFIAQMRAFKLGKNGGRDNAIMQALSQGLSAQQVIDLAMYYASLKIKPGQAQEKYVKLGRTIYQGGLIKLGLPACSACHGPKGLGNAQAGFPAIGGQHAEYILAQLEAYKKGTRGGGLNDMMSGVSKNLTKEQMQAVASYIAGLH